MEHLTVFTALLALSFVPLARANCVEDFNGNVFCNGLSSGARAGIGIAIAAAFLILMFFLAFLRRRRIAAQNQAFVTQAQQNPAAYQGSYQGYNPGYYPGGGPGANPNTAPQYPPQPYGYDVQSGFAPPQAPPPKYPGYAPPSSPPPALNGESRPYMNKDMP